MHAAADRPEFAPPPQPGMLRALGLAIIAHVLLAVALTQGLQWQRETQDVAAEAELWAAVPQPAAPREEPVPPPVQPPVVKAPPVPERPVAKPPPEPPAQRDADIALEREKQKRELEKRRQAEIERERDQRRKLEAQKKKREEEAARKKEEQARQVAELKRKEDADRKRKQQEQEAREARETKRLAQLREENMRRIQGMAGTGAPGASGSAAQSSGPSASWGSRVQARVRPNIVFSDDAPGNPEALVEVRLAPDGTIVSKRLKKSSGQRAWDDAVLRALDKTEALPRDTDGRVPSGPIDIAFRPRS